MQNFKSTPDSLNQIFKAFGRKLSLGAPNKLVLYELRVQIYQNLKKRLRFN